MVNDRQALIQFLSKKNNNECISLLKELKVRKKNTK